MKQVRVADRAWSDEFCCDKLVIMTNHLYTPIGMARSGSEGSRNDGGSAAFKGRDAAIVELLAMAIDDGVNLDWDHGTVSLCETGYAEGDENGYATCGFLSNKTTDTNTALKLDGWGEISTVQHDETIPEDFYGDKRGGKTFEPTGCDAVRSHLLDLLIAVS